MRAWAASCSTHSATLRGSVGLPRDTVEPPAPANGERNGGLPWLRADRQVLDDVVPCLLRLGERPQPGEDIVDLDDVAVHDLRRPKAVRVHRRLLDRPAVAEAAIPRVDLEGVPDALVLVESLPGGGAQLVAVQLQAGLILVAVLLKGRPHGFDSAAQGDD